MLNGISAIKIPVIVGIVDSGIKYKTKDKSEGYDLVDGKRETGIRFQPPPSGRKGKNTPQQNYFTVIKWFERVVKFIATVIMLPTLRLLNPFYPPFFFIVV